MTAESNASAPWSDESRQKADISGRAEFARVVATRIDQCIDPQGSTVFGVVGPWGSGKTTLLRDIVGQLEEWKIVWFTPWSVADVGSITAEFLSALAEAFPKSQPVREKLAYYSRFGTPALKLIPVVGEAVASVAEHAATELTRRPAWHTEFAKLSAEIASQHERVLVIVDDVDRLDSDELRSLLRVVRLLGRFENVHYLMAYDQATIEGVLGSAGLNGEASDFMEKIVQYPFEVPPTPMVVRRRWTRSILEAVSQDHESVGAEYAKHREQLVRILASGLETPRAAERLREQMLSLAELVKRAEVDILDFTALTWLRIAHHRVWDHIRLHADDYLSWRSTDSDATKAIRSEEIEALVQRGRGDAARDAVTFLFEENGSGGRRWRMQTGRYFDRYFQVGLADDDISERMIDSALRQLSTGIVDGWESATLRSIVLDPDEDKPMLALEIADKLRQGSTTTSAAVLDFVEDLCAELRKAQAVQSFRLSAADRWLTREIYLALASKMASEADLINRFGYSLLTLSAYLVSRLHEFDSGRVKRTFANVARIWANEVRDEPLVQTLLRDELLQMTSFCLWVEESSDQRGYLADRVTDLEALIAVATEFVSYNEWVGASVKYDVVFRQDEFLFATYGASTEGLPAYIPELSTIPEYSTRDLKSRSLTKAQRRHFAILCLRGEEPGTEFPA